MVQGFYHPWMVLNCTDPPSSPDTVTLHSVNQFPRVNTVRLVAKPYKIPQLGVLTVVATTDGPQNWYLVDVVLPAIPKRFQTGSWN